MLISQFPADCPAKVQETVTQTKVSIYVYTVMAQPIFQNSPAFCLQMFGTDQKSNFLDVLNHFEQLLKTKGITIFGYSSDGDTRLLKAMEIKNQLSDFLSIDRMNALTCHKIIPKSNAACAFFRLIKKCTDAFNRTDLFVTQRIRQLWSAIFFLRGWINRQRKSQSFSSKNLISQNAYTNAYS